MMEINLNASYDPFTEAFWTEKFHKSKCHSFVAIGLAEIIGYIFCDEEYIISFVIDEKYRGKGIGTQLIHHSLNTYKKPVNLHVRISNEKAQKLYHSLGFIEIETIKDYYIDPTEDAYKMEWAPSPKTKFEEYKKLNISPPISS